MIKIAISVMIGLWLAGCATYKPQSLPDASHIESLQKQKTTEQNSSSVKSLSTIANEVLLYNPDLQALRYELNISDALVLNARLLPDPSLGFSIAYPIGGAGLSNALGSSVGWSLGSLFTRSNEIERALAERNVSVSSYMWQAHLGVANALVLAGRLKYLREQQKIAAKNLTLSESLYKATSQKAAKSDETLLVESSRKAAMLDALDIKAKIDEQIARIGHELNYQLGLAPSKTIDIEPFETKEIHPDPKLLFQKAIEKRPDIVAQRFAYLASDAVYRRNILAQFPSFSVTLNWSSDTSKIKTFGPSVAFDLPLWNRNRGGVALSSALRDRQKESYTAALERAQNDIVALIDAIEKNQALLKMAEHESKGNERFVKALERAFKNGDVTLSDYAAKMNEIYLKELWLIGVKQTLFEQQIALSLASGSDTIFGEF